MASPTEAEPEKSSCDLDEAIEDILDNIDGHIRGPQEQIASITLRGTVDSTETFPESLLEPRDLSSSEAFHKWILSSAQSTSRNCSRVWSSRYLKGAVEFSLREPTKALNGGTEDDDYTVQVIGRFCREDLFDYKGGLLDFCMQAQKVFTDQPIRLFLHGVYLYGTLLELWTFDRSGLQCSQQFDVATASSQLSSILSKFGVMPNADLGENDLVKHDGSNWFIGLEPHGLCSSDRLYLGHAPVAWSEDMVGSGTTCYRARASSSGSFDLIVKFKWRPKHKRPEEQLLKLAEARGARGILSLRYEKSFQSTSEFRSLSPIQSSRKFSCVKRHALARHNNTRKQNERYHPRQRGILECTHETSDSFEDRLLTLVVLSPAGRPLQSFKDRLDLLLALRDAVKAHRSLFQVAKILHQDISSGNIIIVDPLEDGDPHSILIDLDVAMDQAQTRGEPGSIIGTRPYMAIGVLLGRRHTYRHDLESFLYVFLRIIVCDGAENPPPASRLREWNQGSFSQSAKLKLHDMEEANFSNILAEFPPKYHSLKPLAEQLRKKLFPVIEGEMWTATIGSPTATNALYDGIIAAFDEHITLERSQ